jgi:hypothetical protein
VFVVKCVVKMVRKQRVLWLRQVRAAFIPIPGEAMGIVRPGVPGGTFWGEEAYCFVETFSEAGNAG